MVRDLRLPWLDSDICLFQFRYYTPAACNTGPRPADFGQIFRAVNVTSENCIYHQPSPGNCVALGGTGSAAAWLEWTQAPPSVYDLDGDGKNEIIVRILH